MPCLRLRLNQDCLLIVAVVAAAFDVIAVGGSEGRDGDSERC